MKKDKEWLEDEVGKIVSEYQKENIFANFTRYMIYDIKDAINQLDEPEVLSQELIYEKAIDTHVDTINGDIQVTFKIDDLENLLVPKQEKVDRAYKDGYEKGKQHGYEKGYSNNTHEPENTEEQAWEPETVASVFVDYLQSTARLKQILAMEVEVKDNE